MKIIFKYIYLIYSSIILVVSFIAIVPIALFAALFLGRASGKVIYFCARMWFRVYSFFVGLYWKNMGAYKPNKNQSYIFVANHDSYYDILAMVLGTKQPYRVLGKEELTKIPVFGYLYKKAVITVNRKSEEDRKNSVARLKYYLTHKISIFIFPEGTFNETQNIMGPFYDGAFKIALETNTPIQPMVIYNCNKLLNFNKKFVMQPGVAKYEFLPAIPVDTYAEHNIQSLKELVYKKIETALIIYTNNNK